MPRSDQLRPILVTGSHRSGSTWVGKMLSLSYRVHYLGEIFHPEDGRLPPQLLKHWFQYVPAAEGASALREAVRRILDFDFHWPQRTRLRRIFPSRNLLFKSARRWLGYPRPLLKDPIAVLSCEWLASCFDMDVVCLVRHPAAFVASLRKADWGGFDFGEFLNQPQLMEDWLYPLERRLKHPPDSFVERGALLWLCLNQPFASQRARHPEWSWWRLEDISRSPEQAFAEIFRSCHLNYTSRIRREVWRHSRPGNPVDASTDGSNLIRRDSRAAAESWKGLLTPSEVASVRRLVEPLAQRYYSEEDWQLN